MIITSKENPLVKRIASLKEKKGRRKYGQYLIEGIKQLREAVACGAEICDIVQAESYGGEPLLSDRVQTVSDNLFCKLSEEVSPQGILAVLKIPDGKVSPPQGNCLLLDAVSDPGNLGTIIRTANAAGYQDIYLRNCTDPYAPKCIRSAMSGVFFVRLHIGGFQEIVLNLQTTPCICADMSGQSVFSFQPPERFCLVIGNEANGVSKEVREICTATVKIPMRESCESLNAGVSAGILMYELLRNKIGTTL